MTNAEIAFVTRSALFREPCSVSRGPSTTNSKDLPVKKSAKWYPLLTHVRESARFFSQGPTPKRSLLRNHTGTRAKISQKSSSIPQLNDKLPRLPLTLGGFRNPGHVRNRRHGSAIFACKTEESCLSIASQRCGAFVESERLPKRTSFASHTISGDGSRNRRLHLHVA